jgi:hypothetical protein
MSSNRVTLFVNHAADKIKYDRIALYKRSDCKYTVYFKPDCTKETQDATTPIVLVKDDHHDLLDYVEDVLDLMMNDNDRDSFGSIDVMIPGMPIVALHPKNLATKPLLLRAIRSWAASATSEAD